MFDAVSKSRQDVTFCNGFQTIRRDGEVLLQFSWVIDNGPYTGPHLHQIERYKFVGGRLASVGAPDFAIADGWSPPNDFKALNDKLVLKRFMASIALPPMKDLMQLNDEMPVVKGPPAAAQGHEVDCATV